jgi:tRNA threonylcarbamoyl adenosine modification protein YeaZ
MQLAIDTSGADQALVLLNGRRTVAAEDWVRARGDPPVLVRLDSLMRRAGATQDDLQAVAAARGPGSFTGLRVGLSLAAGIAYGRAIALFLLDSLPVLARRALDPPATVALRDAGRGEVYAWRRDGDPQRISVDELAEWLPPDGRIITEPAGALARWLPSAARREVPDAERRPLSAGLADYANWVFEFQKPLRYDEIQALYVQPTAAEERRRKAP